MSRTYYRETTVDGVGYRVGFAEDGYAVSVHRLRVGAPGRRPGLVKVKVTDAEGVAAVKQITGGTMRWYVGGIWNRRRYR